MLTKYRNIKDKAIVNDYFCQHPEPVLHLFKTESVNPLRDNKEHYFSLADTLFHFLLDTQTAPNYKKVKDLLENIIHFIHKSGTILRSGKILCPLELESEFGAKRRVTRIQLLDYILPQVRLLD